MNIRDYIKNNLTLVNICSIKNNIVLNKNRRYISGKINKKNNDNKIDELINNILNTIKNNNSINENLLIENNIKTLKISKISLLDKFLKNKYNAFYIINKNRVYYDKNFLDLLPHEILHMASSKIEDNTIYSGFLMIDSNNKINIGEGLNEGFTELLCQKYFKNNNISAYQLYETNVSKYLTDIIGFEKMKSYYFNADLNGLIKELKEYDEIENIVQFMKNIDYVKSNFVINENLKKIMLDTYLTLYKWRTIDLNNKFKNNIINEEEYKNEVLDNARIYPARLLTITASINPITFEMKEEVRRRLK